MSDIRHVAAYLLRMAFGFVVFVVLGIHGLVLLAFFLLGSAPLLLPLGHERSGELFVEGEELFHALAVGEERFVAVATVHCSVELLV